MNNNKGDALKCLKIGKDALVSGNRACPLKFLAAAQESELNPIPNETLNILISMKPFNIPIRAHIRSFLRGRERIVNEANLEESRSRREMLMLPLMSLSLLVTLSASAKVKNRSPYTKGANSNRIRRFRSYIARASENEEE